MAPAAPIETHCPNPRCARVHRVKAKYAGQRGKCPACAHWMYVPVPPAASTFGWAATVFLLLGITALGAVAATPWLPGHVVEASGELATLYGPVEGVRADYRPYVVGVPLGLALFPLFTLLLGGVYQRPTTLGRASLYLGVLLTSALAFVAIRHAQEQLAFKATLDQAVAASKAAGAAGDASFRPGPYLFAAVGGSAAAAALFLLAAFALHRRAWSRVFGMVVLGLPLAVAAVWAFRKSLGLESLRAFWE